MSEIDWQADLEKKVANLLRKFKAEAEAHGAKLLVQVTVEVRDWKTPHDTDNAGVVPTRSKKKKVDDES